MNSTTEDILEFLNFPDLDLGTTPLDLEMLQDPALTRELTTRLLNGPLPPGESRAAAEALKGRLDDADWSAVSQAMQGRVKITEALFDTSAEDAAMMNS